MASSSEYFTTGPRERATRNRIFGEAAPQLLPPAAAALYPAADGRGQKYSSFANDCAIRSEPTTVPSGLATRLPFALVRNSVWPNSSSTAGYSTQQITSVAPNSTRVARMCFDIGISPTAHSWRRVGVK